MARTMTGVAARRPSPKYVPAFAVQKLEGTFTKKVVHRDKKKGFVYEDKELPKGYMVSFPRGHSIHIETFEELERLGYDATEVPLVDEDGEAVGSVPNPLKTKEKANG